MMMNKPIMKSNILLLPPSTTDERPKHKKNLLLFLRTSKGRKGYVSVHIKTRPPYLALKKNKEVAIACTQTSTTALRDATHLFSRQFGVFLRILPRSRTLAYRQTLAYIQNTSNIFIDTYMHSNHKYCTLENMGERERERERDAHTHTHTPKEEGKWTLSSRGGDQIHVNKKEGIIKWKVGQPYIV